MPDINEKEWRHLIAVSDELRASATRALQTLKHTAGADSQQRVVRARCATCKWWGDSEKDDQAPPGYKVCTHPKIDDYGHLPDDDKPNPIERMYDDALTSAWQEMGAAMTGPRFGCVHHEEAP